MSTGSVGWRQYYESSTTLLALAQLYDAALYALIPELEQRNPDSYGRLADAIERARDALRASGEPALTRLLRIQDGDGQGMR